MLPSPVLIGGSAADERAGVAFDEVRAIRNRRGKTRPSASPRIRIAGPDPNRASRLHQSHHHHRRKHLFARNLLVGWRRHPIQFYRKVSTMSDYVIPVDRWNTLKG